MQIQAGAAVAVRSVRMPLKPPGECSYGTPYGVRGLCRNWSDGHWAGPLKHPCAVYRAQMGVNVWFGSFIV